MIAILDVTFIFGYLIKVRFKLNVKLYFLNNETFLATLLKS